MRSHFRAIFRAPAFRGVASSLTVAIALSACRDQGMLPRVEHTPEAAELQTLTYAQLAARMSRATGVPVEALSQRSSRELSARFSKSFGGAETRSARLPFTPDELAALVRQVVTANPDVYAPSEGDFVRMSRELGGLSTAEIARNLSTIRELYEAKLRYELYNRTEQMALARAVPTSPSFLTVTICEAWYSLNFPARAYDTKRAADYATARAGAIYGTQADGVRANAFKHAFWNAILPIYTGKYFAHVDDAIDWAKLITDAHECGSRSLASAMDYHNNAQGRNFIRPYLWVDVSWYGSRSVKGPDLTFIESQIKSRASKAVFVTTAAQMDSYPNSLVYLVK